MSARRRQSNGHARLELKRRILRLLASSGRAWSSAQVAAELNIKHAAAGILLSELQDEGLVVDLKHGDWAATSEGRKEAA